MTSTDTPRVYVAILADYNAGELTGEWIDAVDADDMRTEIARILRTSRYPNVEVECPVCAGLDLPVPCAECDAAGKVPSAEEYAIYDYDGFYGLAHILGEYPSLDNVARNGRMIEEHGVAWALWADNLWTIHMREEDFQEAYCGQYDTEKDFAEELVDDTGMLSDAGETLARYLDYDAFARDLFLDGYTLLRASDGEGHVFRDC